MSITQRIKYVNNLKRGANRPNVFMVRDVEIRVRDVDMQKFPLEHDTIDSVQCELVLHRVEIGRFSVQLSYKTTTNSVVETYEQVVSLDGLQQLLTQILTESRLNIVARENDT